MAIFDFTMPIDRRMPTYPEDPKLELFSIATIQKQGWNEQRITLNSHFGTHIDAPFHMLEQGKKLTDFPLETFMGEAIVLDVRGQAEIKPDLKKVKAQDIVFLCTGHTKKMYSKDFFKNNPVLTLKTAQLLIEKKIKILGIDSYTPDNEPYDVHKLLFKHDILIVENLVDIDQLAGKRFQCSISPLKIQDADGAPCRVIGIL